MITPETIKLGYCRCYAVDPENNFIWINNLHGWDKQRNDYPVIGNISTDRKITFHQKDLPMEIKSEIRKKVKAWQDEIFRDCRQKGIKS